MFTDPKFMAWLRGLPLPAPRRSSADRRAARPAPLTGFAGLGGPPNFVEPMASDRRSGDDRRRLGIAS